MSELSTAAKIEEAIWDARDYETDDYDGYLPRHGLDQSRYARARIDRRRAAKLLVDQAARGNYGASLLFYALFGAQYPAAS